MLGRGVTEETPRKHSRINHRTRLTLPTLGEAAKSCTTRKSGSTTITSCSNCTKEAFKPVVYMNGSTRNLFDSYRADRSEISVSLLCPQAAITLLFPCKFETPFVAKSSGPR